MLTKIAFIFFMILALVIYAPTIILDSFVSRVHFSNFSTLSDFNYRFAIREDRVFLVIDNDTDDYWENVGARFHLYDVRGIRILDKEGNGMYIDVEVGNLRPGENSSFTSEPLPEGVRSIELFASRQRKVRN
jgi:hypothetical protein